MEYVELDAEQSKKLDELMSSVGGEWANKLDQRGLPGTTVLEAFRKALKAPEQ